MKRVGPIERAPAVQSTQPHLVFLPDGPARKSSVKSWVVAGVRRYLTWCKSPDPRSCAVPAVLLTAMGGWATRRKGASRKRWPSTVIAGAPYHTTPRRAPRSARQGFVDSKQDDSETVLWDAVQRAQMEVARRNWDAQLADSDLLVSVGEVARQGIPLTGLESRLFALAARHEARIVTTKKGELFFAFPSKTKNVMGSFFSARVMTRLFPLIVFAASESFFVFFPIPFILLRMGALAWTADERNLKIPIVAWAFCWPVFLIVFLCKNTFDDTRGEQCKLTSVEAWAKEDNKLNQQSLSDPIWAALVDEMWPWVQDPNQTTMRVWRRRIIAQLVLGRGGKLTAAEMAPYLDPDPERHATVEDFLLDADGIAQPFVAELGGQPDWQTSPIVYRFPEELCLQAASPEGIHRPWHKRVARFVLGAVQSTFGWDRIQIPSYLEENTKPPRPNIAVRLQLVLCMIASLWVPAAHYAGILGSRVGFVTAGLALRMWPSLLVASIGLYLVQLQRLKLLNRQCEAAISRNKLRKEAASRSAQQLGKADTVVRDLERERWYDTVEPTENFELRNFDDKVR